MLIDGLSLASFQKRGTRRLELQSLQSRVRSIQKIGPLEAARSFDSAFETVCGTSAVPILDEIGHDGGVSCLWAGFISIYIPRIPRKLLV